MVSSRKGHRVRNLARKTHPDQRFCGPDRTSDEEMANLKGMVPQYSESRNKIPVKATPKFVWILEADKFWFGILPGNPQLCLPDVRVGTMEDIFNTLRLIDSEGVAVRHFESMQKKQEDYLHGFCDIAPMVASWIRQPKVKVQLVPEAAQQYAWPDLVSSWTHRV